MTIILLKRNHLDFNVELPREQRRNWPALIAHSVRMWLEILQTVHRPGVCSFIYCIVYYKEPLKLFKKSIT